MNSTWGNFSFTNTATPQMGYPQPDTSASWMQPQQSYQNPAAQNQFSFTGGQQQPQNPTGNPFSMQQQSSFQQPQNQFSFTSSTGNNWQQPQTNSFMQANNSFSSFSQPSFSTPSYGTNTMSSWNSTPSYASMMGNNSNTMMSMGMSNPSFNSAFSFNTAMGSNTMMMMGNTMQSMMPSMGMPSAVPQGYTKFMPVPEQDKQKDGTVKTLYFQAVTRQPEYQNQSFEELRAEFYKATNNATNIMPQQPMAPTTTNNMMGNPMMPTTTSFDTSFSFNTMGGMNTMMGNTMQSFNQFSTAQSFTSSFNFQQPQAPTTIPSTTDFFNTGMQSFSQQSWSTPSFQSTPSFTSTTTPSFTGNWMQQPTAPAQNTGMPSFSFDTNPSMNMMGMSMPSFTMSQPVQTSFSFDTNSAYNTGMNWANPAPMTANTAFSYTMPQMQQQQPQQPMMNWANPMAMQPAMPMMAPAYNFMQPTMPAATYNPSISYFGAAPTEDLNTILSNPYGANQSVIDKLAKATTEESAATTTTASTQQQQKPAELLDATSKWDGKVFKTALVRPRLVSNKQSSRKNMFSAEDELEDSPQFDEPSSANAQNIAVPSVSSVTELKRLTIDPGKDTFEDDELAINGHSMQPPQQDGLYLSTGVPTLQPSQLQAQHQQQAPSVQSTPPMSLHGTPMVQQPLLLQQQQQQQQQPLPQQQLVDDRQAPKLTRADYYTEPSMADLSRMSAESRSQIHQFTVGRYNVGSIMFTGCTDVNNLDLDYLIEINQGSVEVYSDSKFTHVNKPQVGTELNKPSVISLFVGKKKNFEKKLRSLVEKMEDATFESYDPHSGKWVFKVAHYTKWGLPEDFDDSDEEEQVVQPQEQKLAPQMEQEEDDESEGEDIEIAEEQINMDDVPANEEMIDREPEPSRLPQQLGLNAYKIQRMNMLFDDEKPVQKRPMPTAIPVIPPHRLHIMEQVQSLKYNTKKFVASSTAPTLPMAAFSPMKQPLVASKDTVVHKNLLCPQILLRNAAQYSDKPNDLVKMAHSFGTRFGGVRNQYLSLVQVSGKPQQSVDIASKQLLLHQFPSTELSNSNAIGVHNVTACEEVYVTFLEHHFSNSSIQYDDNTIPMYGIPSDVLSHYLQKATEDSTNNDKAIIRKDADIWELTHLLFGKHQNNATESLQRKYELSQWFKKQLVNTPLPTTASANIKILHYLSCYKIHEAVLEAQNAKAPMVALLISQFTNPEMKQQVVAALKSQTIDSELECIFLLLAGRLDMAISHMITKYNTELKLNWKHCLGMFLWYDEHCSHSNIEQLVRKYSQSKVVIKPTINMPEDTSYDKPQYDIRYQLLQLYSGFPGVNVLSVCSAHPWSVEPKTTRALCLLFHLYQALRLNANKTDAHGHVKGNWDALLALYVRYAHELEQAGHWQWALYIYCQAVAPLTRKSILLKQVLDRHVIASYTCTERERWVLEKLKLPKALVYASKAQKIAYMRVGEVVLTSSDEYHQLDSHLEQIKCLLEARMFEEANKLMCKHVAPFMLLANNKSKDIYELLKQVTNGVNELHAATYFTYQTLMGGDQQQQQQQNRMQQLDKLLKMLSKWQNACTNSNNATDAQQKREFVAVAEMMTKVSTELIGHEQTCAKAATLPYIPAAFRIQQVHDLCASYFK